MGAKPVKMSETEIEVALTSLPTWRLANGKLHREYRFSDFVQAFGFMVKAALAAESANHHPEWSNVYHTVRIDLSTHDVGGISNKDFELAHRFEVLAAGAK